MLNAIFTLDYEIHGNGDGCPYELMVEPTARMMALFERYGAKLTIMADVAEIVKFKEYQERTGRDDYSYHAIANQLCQAIERGHDVQLHLHASYFNSTLENGRWIQDWSEYNFASLPAERMVELIRVGKEYLEETIRPVAPHYRCTVFRAANWSVSPSRGLVQALISNGMVADTSVFKYGKRDGLVRFDYSGAYSNILPWYVDENDICCRDPRGKLVEVPIYAERRWIGSFVSVNRIHRLKMTRKHRVAIDCRSKCHSDSEGGAQSSPWRSMLATVIRRHAWKADFNQCTGHQLIRALERAGNQVPVGQNFALPFVLIGHSKQFSARNERTLTPFLEHIARRRSCFGFATFTECLPDATGIAGVN